LIQQFKKIKCEGIKTLCSYLIDKNKSQREMLEKLGKLEKLSSLTLAGLGCG